MHTLSSVARRCAVVAATAKLTSYSSTSTEGMQTRFYKRKEIEVHDSAEKRIWVTYKDGVYDITDFIANHPGGSDKIALAAGKAIDPFWRIYQAHLKSPAAMEQLEAMRIGTLDPNEPKTVVDSSDPYSGDPERHPGLKLLNTKPCNAEVPPPLQTQSFLTPNDLWFIRHHHPVPALDPNTWKLGLAVKVKAEDQEEEDTAAALKNGIAGGGGEDPCEKPSEWALTLQELKDNFPKAEVTATIQCGGNRRSGLNLVAPTSGIAWGTGAISTAKFGGVRLRDLLVGTGKGTGKGTETKGLLLDPSSSSSSSASSPGGGGAGAAEALGVRHVIFKAADGMEASIPIEKAIGEYGDVLLAYEMNGEALPREHGYPLRAVVPGHVGVRHVKWLTSVVCARDEAQGPWQRGIAYKGFSPNVQSFEGIDVEKILSIQEMPVQSAFVVPNPEASAEANGVDFLEPDGEDGAGGATIEASGWAWSGGGRGVVRVDVSGDGGATWHTADLTGEGAAQHPSRAWAWTFWECEVPLSACKPVQGGGKGPGGAEEGAAEASGEAPGPGSEVELCCRCTDASYNVQPERAAPFWNKRGLNNNSWHRVRVKVK